MNKKGRKCEVTRKGHHFKNYLEYFTLLRHFAL